MEMIGILFVMLLGIGLAIMFAMERRYRSLLEDIAIQNVRSADLMAYAAWHLRRGDIKPTLASRLEEAARNMNDGKLPTDSDLFGGVVFGEDITAASITTSSITANKISVGKLGTITAELGTIKP